MTNNFKMVQVENSGVADSGCLFRITALIFFLSRIPGSKKETGFQIRIHNAELTKNEVFLNPNCYVAMSNVIRDVSQILDSVVSSPIQG
jgi:hypothetical protein